MDDKIQSGQAVKLLSSLGLVTLIVVADLGEVLLVCRADEFERAKKERRDPLAIGFKKTDLVELV